MGQPKRDNVASLKRHKETVGFDIEKGDGLHEVDHRWRCTCGTRGQWYNRAYGNTYLFRLWIGHLQRKHPKHSLTLELLGKETEGL